MKCEKCGNELPLNSSFCSTCGNAINKHKKKYVIKICISLCIVLAVLFTILMINRVRFKNLLLKDWERVEKGENNTLYTLELDFSDNTIDYNFNSFYINNTISKFNYKIVGRNKIKIDEEIYTFSFNEDKTMMTITPSFTKIASSETWFNH